MMILTFLIYLSLIVILYTYLLYPIFVRWLSKSFAENSIVYGVDDDLPHVRIILSAFNEESIIAEKIQSVLNTSYPDDKYLLIIGSDQSDDRTNEIVQKWADSHPQIRFQDFKERRGKALVLNDLFPLYASANDIVILTDANVLFTEDTIFELVRHFKNSTIGQVAANVINYDVTTRGIAAEEQFYIHSENHVKYSEGVIWGSTMGAFGACYAIRSELIPQIPKNYLMEDFFISLHVLQSGYKAIMNLRARVLEDIPGSISEEYKRKKRISAGNYQNLAHYAEYFLKNFWPRGFVFFSHKVLRWFTPFFMLLAALAIFISYFFYGEHRLLFFSSLAICILAGLDFILQKAHLYFKPLRMIRYFLMMNIALLEGLFKYSRGVQSNTWKPTLRNN